jgi:nucleoside-diphosphate-sugar epimerase
MKAIIFGGVGLLGSAIAKALRSHGHEVITAGRSGCDLHVDFCYASHTDDFLPLLQGMDKVSKEATI